MEKKYRLGHSDVYLKQPLGVGTMLWGDAWVDKKFTVGEIFPSETLFEISDILLKNDVTFFDTAEGYGGGASETRLSECLDTVDRGDEAIIATKFIPTIWRWTRSSFNRSLCGSLNRMNKTFSDIYFIHTPLHPLPLEFWCHCVAKAAKAGLIKAIGLSNFNAEQVRRAQVVFSSYGLPIAANQILLNLLDYNCPQIQEVIKVCKEYNITMIGYSPVGQGLLVDGLTPEKFSKIRAARIKGVKWDHLQALRKVIKEVADENGKSMAQICLNWAMCHDIVPLVGVRTVKQAQEAVGSLNWKLSEAQVARLDAVALTHSTLKKPAWRRAIFVLMISLLVMSYYVFSWIEPLFGYKRHHIIANKKKN